MSGPRRSESPDMILGFMQSGCRILLDPYTHWPIRVAIAHFKPTCCCATREEDSALGDDSVAVREFLFYVAYEYHYKEDPEKYNALACNEIIKAQAARLGLDLEGRLIWDVYPDCLPPRPRS
ncbi:hypothetical protein F4823DRAFT_560671 [Ustulina deusta]|nr:hypothetical protein F4823DRAFT_560671 [Ustulina deusta]